MRIPAFHTADAVRALGVRGAFCVITGTDDRPDPTGLAAYRWIAAAP